VIKVTRLDNSKLFINVSTIQSLQSTPDTLITFNNKIKLMVKEPLEVISEKIVEYERNINEKEHAQPGNFYNFVAAH